MMQPSQLYDVNGMPIVYSVKTLTALERSKNALNLEQQAKETGFVDSTAKYFDFHKTLYNPTLTEHDVFNKAHDDTLADMRAEAKLI